MANNAPESVFEAALAYISEAPSYHIALEMVLILWIVYLLFFSRQYKPESKRDKLTKEEEEQIIAQWEPEPLVPNVYPTDRAVDPAPIVTGVAGLHVTVNGKRCLNLATFNFLGLLGEQGITSKAAESIQKYGVGSCGPRGFYGTFDVHLELEEKLAKFLGCEEAIIYSYGFAAISSAIPAYSKRRDIIFCDSGANYAVQKGLVASRSKVKYFKHNDMEDLERLLEEQRKLDEKNPAKAKVTRKFIVAESLYMNYGDLVPLPKLVELRSKYQVPIFLEESLSFGVLGKTGRGATEHFGVPVNEVDVIVSSMETSMASVGGFCVGKSYIIDHQRLSGLGYCFSASLPPLTAVASIEALGAIDSSSQKLERLRSNAKCLRKLLSSVKALTVGGEDVCPVVHVHLSKTVSNDVAAKILQDVADQCIANGVAVVTSKYLDEESLPPPPSLRLTVSSEHSEEDLGLAVSIIEAALAKCLP